MRNGPIARRRSARHRSTPGRREGESIIGRPAVLKLVLTSTGRPVRARTDRAAGHERLLACGRRSGPGPCRRRARPPGCDRAIRRGHGGRTACTGSASRRRRSRRPLGRDEGGDRTELLAPLDVVEAVSISSVGRAGQQAAVPEARGPYSLRPWNHPTTPSAARTAAPHRRCRRLAGGRPRRRQVAGDVVVAPASPERGRVHRRRPLDRTAGSRAARRRAPCRHRRPPAAPTRPRRDPPRPDGRWRRS